MALTIRALSLSRSSTACAAILLSVCQTQAQTLNWDWGGEKKIDGTGRELVHMTAAKKSGDIIVSFGDRKLYFVTKPGEALSYPIAVPREDSRWQGTTAVTSKRENPSWTPTPSMRTANPKLPSWVPGGHPMNPLGIRALYLGSSTYRIHGTDAPWTIGTSASSGCVRLYNRDVVDLYPRVRVGASVLVTWDKFNSTPDPDAKIAAAVEDNAPQQSRKNVDTVPPAQRTAEIKTGSLPETSARVAEADLAQTTRPHDKPVAPRTAQARKRPASPVVKKYTPPEELSI